MLDLEAVPEETSNGDAGGKGQLGGLPAKRQRKRAKILESAVAEVVEVINETVDLTNDDAPTFEEMWNLKKKEKKKKKKDKENPLSSEARRMLRAERKARYEAKFKTESEQAAQHKVDQAALRYAERLEQKDKAILADTVASSDILPSLAAMMPLLPPEKPAGSREEVRAGNGADKNNSVPEAPKPISTFYDFNDSVPARPINPLVAETPVAAAPVKVGAVPRGPTRFPEAGAKPDVQMPAPSAILRRNWATVGASMAAAIASAQKQQNLGSAGFASFEAFDAQASHEKAHGLEYDDERDESCDDNSTSDDEGILSMEHFSFQDLPEELLPSGSEAHVEPGFYIAHFIRYVTGAWQHALESGKVVEGVGLTAHSAAMFQSEAKLGETKNALKPLFRQLRYGKLSPEVIRELVAVVSLAVDREYAACNEEYVAITMGRKTWHQALPCIQQQQNHGGSLKKVIQQSALLDFDKDPVVDAYMRALRRIIQFAQCIRPPDDPSKSI